MPDILKELADVLDRTTSINALDALIETLDPAASALTLAETAMGFDANVFLRMAEHQSAELLIDYLAGIHKAPLILPGQAIQEFWNNQHEVVSTIAKPLKSSFNNFKANAERLGDEFGTYLDRFGELIGAFEAEHGYAYEQSAIAKTTKLLQTLKQRASVPFAQRSPFYALARQRKGTKTPPGFKDSGDGDFYVWVDFLFGLREAQLSSQKFSRAVLVTNDVKHDWSRAGRAHPILVAEAGGLLAVPFETWTLNKLVEKIQEATK